MKKTCAMWRKEVAEGVKKYNALVLDDENTTMKMLNEQLEAIDNAVKEHNAQSQMDALQKCAKAKDPMLEAVITLQYPRIAVKIPKSKDGETPAMEIVDRVGDIDTLRLHKRIKGNGIGKEANWWNAIEKLNFLLTARTAAELGIDPKKINGSFAMDKISAEMKLCDNPRKNPVSDENLLGTLQSIINKMIGEEYVATPEDVKFLIKSHSKKDNRNKLKVSCQNNSHFRQTIVDICHRIVTNGEYDVDYKKVKDKIVVGEEPKVEEAA